MTDVPFPLLLPHFELPPPTIAEQIAALELERKAALDEMIAALAASKRAETAFLAIRAESRLRMLEVTVNREAVTAARERGDRATLKLTAFAATMSKKDFEREHKAALNLIVGAREAIEGDV